MSPSMTVDKFITAKVPNEFRPVVAAMRKLLGEGAPDAEEVISYGMLTYGRKRPLAWILPSQTGITLGFREGGRFEDRYNLLRGTAKHARHVRIKKLADVNAAALKYYIKQAVKLDKS